MKRKRQFAHNRAGCPAYGIGHGGPNGRCARLAYAGRGLGRLNDMDIHLRHVADPQWCVIVEVRLVYLTLGQGDLLAQDRGKTVAQSPWTCASMFEG